ncbi:MAG: hypothetical protein WKF63_07575, partial [Thermomicrobiales bacterium]
MYKRPVFLLLLVMLFSVLIGGGRFAAATARGPDGHPVIGSWTVESDPGDTEFSPRLTLLSADGTALFVSGQKITG